MTSTALAGRDATWVERGGISAVFMALGVVFGAWAAAISGIKSNLGLTDGQLSFALLTLAGTSVVSTLAAGHWSARFGTGRSTVVSGFLLAIGITLPALARNLPELMIAVGAIGFANGFLDVSMNGYASDVERRWRLPIMSSFHGAFSLGGLLGSGCAGGLAALGAGVAGQLLFAGGTAGVLVLFASFSLGVGPKSDKAEGTGLVWPTGATWALCLIALFCLMIEGAVADWSAVYLATVVGATRAASAAGYAAFSVAMTAGRLGGDAVVRRIGRKTMVILGGACAAVGLAAGVVAPAFLPSVVGYGLVGLGLANVVPTVFGLAGRLGKTPAAGMASVVSVGYAGFISGPPIIGTVAGLSDLRVAIGLLVLVAAGVVVAGLWLREPPEKSG